MMTFSGLKPPPPPPSPPEAAASSAVVAVGAGGGVGGASHSDVGSGVAAVGNSVVGMAVGAAVVGMPVGGAVGVAVGAAEGAKVLTSTAKTSMSLMPSRRRRSPLDDAAGLGAGEARHEVANATTGSFLPWRRHQ